jgi:hypothetical protein
MLPSCTSDEVNTKLLPLNVTTMVAGLLRVSAHVDPLHFVPGAHHTSGPPLAASVTGVPTGKLAVFVHGAVQEIPAGAEVTVPDPGPKTRAVTVSITCCVPPPLLAAPLLAAPLVDAPLVDAPMLAAPLLAPPLLAWPSDPLLDGEAAPLLDRASSPLPNDESAPLPASPAPISGTSGNPTRLAQAITSGGSAIARKRESLI